MSIPSHIWRQLKNLTADDLIAALERDNWTCDKKGGSMRIYLSQDEKRRVSVHYHPKKTFGAKLLQGLLKDIGWTEADMSRLKLI
ncbi:MAG: type II toxin-antitoxin system HicA family toxin [Xanthomonadaceae bacterium]|nr:type II toxin-antitoxin system HicA family toxin [Xanthomonadaceae bacterium]MDE2084342.1 type II toxin-antitoxin system HicA family toxin [Xanthomonadaceae bacterium]